MMAYTHFASGIFAAVAIGASNNFSAKETILLSAAGLIGSVLPDIDHPKSWLGRRIPFLSIPISAVFGHRGITHSIFALIASLVLSFYTMKSAGMGSGYGAILALGVCGGYASHLVGDWMSNSGIPLFWPLKRKFHAPVVLFTGSAEEPIIALSLWIGAMYIGFKYVMA